MRDVRQAVLRCFAPACGAVLLLGLVVGVLLLPRMYWSGLGVAALELALLSAGYAGVLALCAPWLPESRRFATARSVLAGLLAPIFMGALGFRVPRPVPSASIAILSVAAGVLIGLLLWLPVLRRRRQLASPDPEVALALAALDAELARRTLNAGRRADRQAATASGVVPEPLQSQSR